MVRGREDLRVQADPVPHRDHHLLEVEPIRLGSGLRPGDAAEEKNDDGDEGGGP